MTTERRNVAESLALNALRVVAGLLFWQHGAQKLLGWLGGNQVDGLFTMLGIAGVLEFFGGTLIAVGLFTRPVALVLVLEMVVAYALQHAGRAETLREAVFPILNGGELAALYCFIFLLLAAFGPGSFSLDGAMSRRGGGPP